MSYNSSSDLDAFAIITFESAETGEVVARPHVNTDELSNFSYRVFNVQPFTRYLIKMQLCVGGICSSFSDSKYIQTMEGKPTRVRNVKITEKGNNVLVTWSKPRNISGILRKYSLDVMNSYNVSLPEYPVTVSNTSLSQTLFNLPANQKLLLKIVPYNSMEGESFATWFESPEGLPGIPKYANGIKVKNGRRVVIRWKEPLLPNGKITGYSVSCLYFKCNSL